MTTLRRDGGGNHPPRVIPSEARDLLQGAREADPSLALRMTILGSAVGDGPSSGAAEQHHAGLSSKCNTQEFGRCRPIQALSRSAVDAVNNCL